MWPCETDVPSAVVPGIDVYRQRFQVFGRKALLQFPKPATGRRTTVAVLADADTSDDRLRYGRSSNRQPYAPCAQPHCFIAPAAVPIRRNSVASGIVLCLNRCMTVVKNAVESAAEAETAALLIRRTGARATPARVRVLRLLRMVPAALTHHEIEQAIGDLPVDRVTLYRVLDWLVESGLAHRNADAQRVFRFSAAAIGEHSAHTHFRCENCGRVFCLDAAPPAPPSLPEGFSLSHLELDLRGRCAGCTGEHR